ncbi:alpha-L-rhamnosidase C-terminal domain-containing protein [Kiritimatiella glycovorans]|uniref:Alpha-L-rhamnosidase n=1 Tax=Kiritimatiella glycovorans TaxID=1307763 RepID=A0A0G3EIR1_9BACT|nr:family 78 glycoside hydrolase catalytic domain [Kiritimatiella glycovorans]AKJ64720.1 Alpha-L-rhamnosidase [Kiritimatiella glycovorans]
MKSDMDLELRVVDDRLPSAHEAQRTRRVTEYMGGADSAGECFRSGRAQWIWSREGIHERPEKGSPSHYEVRRFRRTFELESVEGKRCAAAISADSRYRLYCNGVSVDRGPAKGDVVHQCYRELDLTPHLRPGRNVIAALVMDMSPVRCWPPELGAPCSVMSFAGGLILEGAVTDESGADIERLDTDAQWKVDIDRAFSFHNEGCPYGGFVGYFERFDARAEPAGWAQPSFDDGEWAAARELYPGTRFDDRRDAPSPYGLLPEMTAPMFESDPRLPGEVFLPGGEEPDEAWRRFAGGEALEVPARSEVTVLFDAGALQTGYPVLETEGGQGASVRLRYAEALRLPWSTPGANILGRPVDMSGVSTGYADETTGWTFDHRGTMTGWYDEITLDGAARRWEPFHWRTFQFLELTLKTGGEPVTMGGLRYRFCAHPFEDEAWSFTCSDERFNRMADISWRTFRLCAHETFEDCPYYEQMQYPGDNVITSRINMLAGGKTDLSRQALHHFAWSITAEGITQCRYPSTLPVVIPSWSLHTVMMAGDYYEWSGDADTIRELMPAMRSIMDWFGRHTDDRGLPSRLPHWNIVDWSPRWDRGQPPGWDRGPTCIISSQYVYTLRVMADLERAVGETERADALDRRSEDLAGAVYDLFWNADRGVYEDCPGGPDASRYGQAWALLAGAVPEAMRETVVDRMLADDSLDPASFFGCYYLIRALHETGHYDRFPEVIDRWNEMIDGGLSTWAEELTYWRSLCHAWSAFPLLEFLGGVLGIRAGRPGFEEIVVAPHPLHLTAASGHVTTPRGRVEVAWKVENDGLDLQVRGPEDVPLRVILPDGAEHRSNGGAFRVTA